MAMAGTMASNATIKAIESSTVHQIQSGQVIVDLCSVAKELVENSIDAGATSIEVRFKNQGLDAIEVQDNGYGISSENYESIALKHYTSKLSTYDDLSTLQTFGFRGEALSSLSALSRFSIVTCTAQDAPRATKLEFETSGKLKGTSVVSGQRGTTVFVEELFRSLPVRRRELERNIKREWGKVIGLLNQYACIQTGIKFTVSQQPTKGKRMVLFSTKGNPTTRDNIINVFGVKTMNALIAMDLRLELQPTNGLAKKGKAVEVGNTTEVRVVGHVSRPAHGEGRQTPDRQMLYVNGRPCGLPQFTKVFNEVYRSYNASQSPFIFANIQLDTHLYDVNVSPDKRTILLHDQGQMLDNLRESLVELFETQDVTIPVAQTQAQMFTPFKKMAGSRSETPTSVSERGKRGDTVETRQSEKTISQADDGSSQNPDSADEEEDVDEDDPPETALKRQSKRPTPSISASANSQTVTLLSRWLEKKSETRGDAAPSGLTTRGRGEHNAKLTLISKTAGDHTVKDKISSQDTLDGPTMQEDEDQSYEEAESADSRYSGDEMDVDVDEPPVPAIPPPSQLLAPKGSSRPSSRSLKRSTQEVATITIGDHAVTSVIGSPVKRPRPIGETEVGGTPVKESTRSVPLPSFGGRLTQLFSAAGSSQKSNTGKLDITIENVDMPIEEDEDDIDEDQDQDQNEDEDEDEDEEDSLFVSQNTHGGDIDEGNEGREQPEDESSEAVATSPEQQVIQATSEADNSPLSDAGEPVEVEYMDEAEKKIQEDEKVQHMIVTAETKAARELTEDGEKRSQMLLKGGTKRKDTTLNLLQQVKVNEANLRDRIATWESHLSRYASKNTLAGEGDGLEADDAEERLALKISKSDFAKMRIIGQFNLGFVLAVREAATSPDDPSSNNVSDDELFIIDQHASDEKYNFERLQATTVVQSQRLVQPKTLELTAVEEEIILEHATALERNGFIVQVDQSGGRPVGARCQLLSLPLSRETTFSVADLEELIFLLGDNPSASATTIPRPSKVRKMFAMRACRSSIMIGRALSRRQMEKVVQHMGEMEKPWNCPHGRPTMRHLCGLSAWQERGWLEGDGFGEAGESTDWAKWAREKRAID
ncbi:hypothetical protein B0H67DRAFT_664860 [Lasiosphaeris hirsuta]|uniref:DNA mismatch repair protein PMS1 n=1 Tax=Lasiosphaeris hirsuta TaxID=260670 RepID=A0AA40DVH4_9PEZI|nr:hypothetical protein B0H67DRAFT_664860 [Lasiosphaeris hirsuta]